MKSKKKTEVTQQPAKQDGAAVGQPAGQPACVDKLLTNVTTVLTAPTREELAEMVDAIPADVSYGAGAVGRDPVTGAFTLQIHLKK